jgi:hypothetical protein
MLCLSVANTHDLNICVGLTFISIKETQFILQKKSHGPKKSKG